VVIAIDGPGGVGKSTVAKAIAIHLAVPYLDTGATYRAATLIVIIAALALAAIGLLHRAARRRNT